MVSEEEMKTRFDEYKKYIDKCDEVKAKNIELQNKIVMTISTALFGIIITSLDKIMPLLYTTCLKVLFICLVIFNLLTIFFIFISIYFANKSIGIHINDALKHYIYAEEYKEDKYGKLAKKFRHWYVIFICIVIIIFAIMLISILFSKDDKMSKDNKEELVVSSEHYDAPTMTLSFYDSKIQSQIIKTKTDSNLKGVNTQQENNQAQASNIKEDKDN